MSEGAWDRLVAALDCDGPPVRFWLRDDDAVGVTPALRRLEALAAAAEAPVLLAVIPAGAGPDLAAWTAAHPLVTPCQHGYAHANHAGTGERACELGGERDDAAVLQDMAAGRAAMDARFGSAWLPVLVPPWNRIRTTLVPHLAAAGYAALSTFAGSLSDQGRVLPMLDCDLDIIDWRNGRRGRSAADLCARLVRLVEGARQTGAPIGILTHHLAHDAEAWRCLEQLLPLLASHPRAAFAEAAQLLAASTPADPARTV